jgi:hypothetical protein
MNAGIVGVIFLLLAGMNVLSHEWWLAAAAGSAAITYFVTHWQRPRRTKREEKRPVANST